VHRVREGVDQRGARRPEIPSGRDLPGVKSTG
jgi:hypothetical protein